MSWSDRRYGLDNLTPSGGGPRGTYWIIGVTFGVTVLVWLAAPIGTQGFSDVVDMFAVHSDHLLQPWRPLTYQLLHASVGHIFFNMLLLFFMGTMLESHFGMKRFITLYACFGIAGALGVFLEYRSTHRG